MRGRLLTLGALLVLALVPAAAAKKDTVAASTMHFKVVSAKATATLTFSTANADQTVLLTGRVGLVAAPLRKGSGSLGSRSGKVLFPLKGSLKERVAKKTRISDENPYQEQTCLDKRKVGGRGGVTLVRTGSRVEVRWAFPQAKPSFCPGPKIAGSVTSAMKRVYASNSFSRRVVTLVLSGSKSVRSKETTLTYRWRAAITLKRS
jgi:hypothetical protein